MPIDLTPPERVAQLEAQMADVRDDVRAIREAMDCMQRQITAVADQLTGTRGKIQGAIAVIGLLATGGALHWIATVVSGLVHGGTH